MKRINAREILDIYAVDVKQTLELRGIQPTDKIELVMDDGIHETTGWRLIYSTFGWNFNRIFRNTPLTKKYLLTGRVTTTSHMDIMNHGYWDTFEVQGMKTELLEYLDRIAAKSTSVLRNYIVTDLQEYVVTLSMDDYVELVESPEIKEELERVWNNRSKKGIARCHDNIGRKLMKASGLSKNLIVQFVRSKFINMGQVLQCIGPKGYQTGTDSKYYNYPIVNSFLTGLRTIYESAIEATSATKAIRYAIDHVEKGEYFQRKMHLGALPVLGIHWTDCGTKKTMPVTLTKELIGTYEGKLAVRQDGTEFYIWSHNEELLDTTVNVRTPFHCKHFGKQHVCHKCMGYMAYSIPTGSNLGLVSSSELCRDASQSLLSVKHSDFTRLFMEIVLGALEQNYLSIDTEDTSVIRIQEIDDVTGMQLVVDERYLRNLIDVQLVDDTSRLVPSSVTSIYGAVLEFKDSEGFGHSHYLSIAQGSQRGSFTNEFLAYIKRKRWSVVGGNKYVFDLSDWEFDQPVFALPMQSANMLEYIRRLESFVRSTGKTTGKKKQNDDVRRLVDAENIEEGLMNFNSLVSSMLSINIAHQEIVLSSMTARSEEDTRFPETPADGIVLPYETLIRERSASGYYGYEHHERFYGHVRTYLNRNRLYHPMDAIFADYDYGESPPT